MTWHSFLFKSIGLKTNLIDLCSTRDKPQFKSSKSGIIPRAGFFDLIFNKEVNQ
jgi:hypothetical protein